MNIELAKALVGMRSRAWKSEEKVEGVLVAPELRNYTLTDGSDPFPTPWSVMPTNGGKGVYFDATDVTIRIEVID
jgi:hypothetical protein